jgi:proteasome lid subunit RPN8/RPN11
LSMRVSISGESLDQLLSFAGDQHPYEVIVLLRGRRAQDAIIVEEFLLPPFASVGMNFAQFPVHMLPIDFSVVGTAHSHPTGVTRPSAADLRNFYSRVMIIVGHPYGRGDVVAYDSKGGRLPLVVSD